jgi:hypothetical protein
MQHNQNQAPANGVCQENDKHRPEIILSRQDVIGMVFLAIVVFGVAVGYVAHYWVNERSYSIKFFTEAMFSFLALIIVALQVFIYNQQRQIMQRQLDNAAISELAYIGIDDMMLVEPSPLAANQFIRVRMIFRNGGKTPAWGFRSRSQIVVSDGTLEEIIKRFPIEPKKRGGGFVIAGQQKAVDTLFDFKLTDKQLAQVTDKTMKFFILTKVTFRDYLGQRHEMSFRIIYNPIRTVFSEADYEDDGESQ